MLGALVLASTAASAMDGEVIDHPTLVPDKPEKGYPIILDTPSFPVFGGNCGAAGCQQARQTFAINISGRYLVSGGDFLNIELQNGTVINNPYLAIFDTSTKQLVCPNLSVSDEVLAIVPGADPESIIIGGRFKKITGADGVERSRNRVAKIDIPTCSVDRDWIVGPVSSRVDKMTVTGNRLFIGGSFTSVNNQPIAKLAEINLETAAVNTSFSFNFGATYSPIAGLGVSPDGNRLGVIHRATSINGTPLRGTAVINISNPNAPSLTAHRMRSNIPAYNTYNDITYGAVTPDFSAFVIAQGTATISDYVTMVPTTEAPNQFRWQHYMRDSNFSVAVSNNAVYVGGHFCKIDSGPGTTQLMAPNSGPDECTGSRIAGGVWRTQLAALSVVDGTPLTWNPGNNSGRGVGAMTVVPRGLLVGYDGSRTNNLRVGTTAFFDFGAPEPPPPPPPPAGQTCTATANGVGSIVLSWTAIAGENSYVVRRDSKWLATPGNTLTYTDNGAPAGAEYVIRSNQAGVTTNTTCVLDGDPPPPPDGQTCAVTNNGNGTVTLTWTAIAGENKYTVRRNNTWVANYTTLTATTSGTTADEFIIRSRMAGVTTNTVCD